MKATSTNGVPLCVDLDGTLVRTDMLHETLVAALGRNPLIAFALPYWLLRGRAHLKASLAARASFDPALLPFDDGVLALARQARSEQRRVVLATASDASVARRIADSVGIFDDVLATESGRNLKGAAKAGLLVERFGERGFDYVGNDRADIPVWAGARVAYVVSNDASLAQAAARHGAEVRRIPAATRSAPSLVARMLRVYQWAKNLLVFVPIFTAHQLANPQAVQAVFLAFAAFCFAASAAYIINDLADLEADRRHPGKRRRSFASGDVPIAWGLVAIPVLVVAAAVLSWLVSPGFSLVLGVYFATTLAYTFSLKALALIDVFVLAGLYGLRILAGAVAAQVPLSNWLVAFSLFMFLSLAMVKRHAELTGLAGRNELQAPRRGYVVEDRSLLMAMGCASGYAAALVLSLYITSSSVMALYRTPEWLWALIPLLLFWISRVWLRAHRGSMNEDPLLFALRDPASLAIAAGVVIGVAAAT